jgi:uncharacterized protein (DUF697 family)
MGDLTSEGLAGIRLLVCMAKADGVLKPDERYELEEALIGVALPEGHSIETLLDEENDPLKLARKIESSEGRDYTYAAVFALAHCDRELADAEDKILKALRHEWGIKAEEDKSLGKALDASLTTSQSASQTGMSAPLAISDDKKRAAEFEKLLNRYCILTAVTGAIPVPLVPDLLVVPMQVKMVYDIAALFGQKSDKATVQLMFETLGVGTGVRLGVSMLAKFVPIWGSVVGGASAFATSFALGKVAWTFYQSGGAKSVESLKPLFREQQKEGRKEFEKHRAAIDEAGKAHEDRLKALAFELQQDKITQAEYEQKVDALP